MHIPDAKLRAKLDGELPAAESLAAEQHLDACARCRARYAGLARAAAEVQAHFADLPSAPEVDVAAALARTRRLAGLLGFGALVFLVPVAGLVDVENLSVPGVQDDLRCRLARGVRGRIGEDPRR